MIKSLFLAKIYGISEVLDTFYLANVFTITIFNVIGIAITTVLIPEFSSNEMVEENEKSKKGIRSYLSIINIITVIFACLVIVFLSLTKQIVIPKFSEKNQNYFIMILVILMIGQIFRIQTAFSTAIVQSKNEFISSKFATFISALIPVVYLFISPNVNIVLLSLFLSISYLVESIIMVFYQRKKDKYNYRFKIELKNDLTKKLLFNTIPIIVSSAVFQIQILFSNYMVGFFGGGYISVLSNTNQIIGIFQILFISNIISMLYPKISREIKQNLKGNIYKVTKYINLTNVLILLLVWGYISLGEDLIRLLFVRGNFTISDANLVYKFGIYLVLALPISVVRDYCYRIFYSIDCVQIPTKNAISTVIVNICLIIVLKNFFGPFSVVIAPLIGTVFSTINIIRKMKNMEINLNISWILFFYLLFNLIGFIMYTFSLQIRVVMFHPVINFAVNTFISCVIYCSITFLCSLIYTKIKGERYV